MTDFNKNKSSRLPPELAAINSPTSIEECLKFLSELSTSDNYIDRFKLNLTAKYFIDNILSLNLEQLNEGLSYPYVNKKFSQRDTLKKCIENDVVFPILFDCIIQKNVPIEDVYKYADVLSRHGKVEELNTIYDYYQFTDNPVLKLFHNTNKPSDALVEVVIRNDPKYIVKTKCWTDEKVIDWVKSNKEKSIDIISKASVSTVSELAINVQYAFYDNCMEYFTDPKNSINEDIKKHQRNFLINMPATYIKYLQDKHADYLNKKLNNKIRIQQNGNTYTINICQHILCERRFNSIKEIDELFHPYKDLMKENIHEQIGLFIHDMPAFEYALKNNKYAFFVPFSLNDELVDKEREILLALSFNSLLSHVNAKEKNHQHSWQFDMYADTVVKCSDKDFDRYANILKSVKSAMLAKELDNYRLIREINSSPTNNHTQAKKVKI